MELVSEGATKPMGKTRIAIIGAGNHARGQHYPALRHIDEIELCAACDLVQEKLDEVQRAYDIPAVYTNYREMIAREAPDGIVVVMDPMELTGVALGCFELGQNLMIEKPPGCSSAEARQMLDAAQKNGCKAMVSMNRRFMPLLRKLMAMAAERGGPVYASATYNKAGFFHGKWTWPVALTVCDAIHLVDLLRFVCGDVAEVYASSVRRDADYPNSCSAHVVFESGATGTMNNHQCVGARVHRFELHAIGMSAYLDVGNTSSPSGELWLDGTRADVPACEADAPDGVGLDNYRETRHFARWLRGEEEVEAGLGDVLHSVRLAEAIATGYRGKMSEFAPQEDPSTHGAA